MSTAGGVGGMRAARRLAAVVALLVLLVSALPAVAPSVAAGASTTFGTPEASATFGREIVFRQPLTLGGRPLRVELLVERPGGLGPHVIGVPVDADGPLETVLSYRWDVSTSRLVPNTPLTARWRITMPDGSTEVGPPVTIRYDDTRFQWRTRAGEIVRVHWYEGGDAFGRRALEIGEQAVRETAELLGVTETEPIDFFIYAGQDAFYDALGPGTRENVGGQANSDIRTLFALIGPNSINDRWVATVIPHELVHLVFDTAVSNPYHYPPRWLNEGIAVYLSEGYGAQDRARVERAARDGSLMPLDGLAVQFPTGRDRFFLAYSESVSAVDYLIRTHGRDALLRVIATYADGVSDDEAFVAALGVTVAEFDASWRADLDAAEPAVYGPRPAPPGPLPPGWEQDPGTAPSPSPGPTAASTPAGTSASTASPAPTPATGGVPVDGDGGVPIPLILLVASLLVGAGGILLIATGRRRAAATPSLGAVLGGTPPGLPEDAEADDEAGPDPGERP